MSLLQAGLIAGAVMGTVPVVDNIGKLDSYFDEKMSDGIKIETIQNVEEKVLEISLTAGQNISTDILGNPGGYSTIKVITTEDKKLDATDFNRIRNSRIPNVDLSNAYADIIPDRAFSAATHLTSFKFPIGVKTIENGGQSGQSYYGAFAGCTGLTGELIIPDTITSIGDHAFWGCTGFTGNLVIPDSVTSIGISAFNGCSGFTGNLVIPDSVTSIGDRAFFGCSGFDGNLEIPDSVTSIGDSAFNRCSGFDGNLEISDSVTSIGDSAFFGCSRLTGNLEIPDSVTSIGNSAFYRCSGFDGNLQIPDSVTSIGDFAFNGCSGFDGNLVIPDSVTSIGNYAFYRCSGFDGNLEISDSVTSIGDSAFFGCSRLTGNLVIPDSVTSIGISAFDGCSGFDGNLVIPDLVTSIGNYAFYGCSGFDGNLVIPDSVTSIGNYAFDRCNNMKVIMKIYESDVIDDELKNKVDSLITSNAIFEISEKIDVSGTWLENLNEKYNARPKSYNNIYRFVDKSWKVNYYIPTLYSENNISVLKDGEPYVLPTIDSNGYYVFEEKGEYEITLITNLGTTYNTKFKVVDPINKPGIQYEDGLLTLIDNGHIIYRENAIVEDFNDKNELKFDFSNNNWTIESGVLKSEAIANEGTTSNSITINANSGDKLFIDIRVSSESRYDFGCIHLNGEEVYYSTGNNVDFETVRLDLIKGENIIEFNYEKDYMNSVYEDAVFIDSITFVTSEPDTSQILEYKINDGEWQIYNDSVKIPYEGKSTAKIQVRSTVGGMTSEIFEKIIHLELDNETIEFEIDKIESNYNQEDFEAIRDIINKLTESDKKDELQNRLNNIFGDITLDKKVVSANLDIYIKTENMLSLSLDTNSITFEGYSGTEPMEMLGAVNITINSSLPYSLNAYMPTEIANSDKSETLPIDILNIRENTETEYQTFANTTEKIVLKETCEKGNGKVHTIDMKIDSSDAYKADIYKTVIKFEAEQK